MKYITILILLLICFIGTGCNIGPAQGAGLKDIEIKETDTQIVKADNIFNAKDASIGDIVAGMRIESIELGAYGKENYSAYISLQGRLL